MTRLLAATLALTALTAHSGEPEKGAELTLISSAKSIAPGSTVTLGIKVRHAPGYHTYWKNPGAVGYPITVKWTLPDGFQTGPMRWPAPELSKMAAHTVYGYESDATLLVDLTAPARIETEEVTLHANLSWMACAEACHPGTESQTLTMSVSDSVEPDPDLADHFTKAADQIPKTLEGWTVQLACQNDAAEVRLRLLPPAGLADPGTLRFFSEDGQVSSEPTPTLERQSDGSYQLTTPRSRFSPKDQPTLPFVLVADRPLSTGGPTFGALEPAYPAP